MNTTATTTRTATAFATMLDGMISARRQYAADHGFEAVDSDIAASVKASLLRMMEEAK